MAAHVVELSDAIADYIRAQTYSFTFNTSRQWPVRLDLADTETTNVWVYPVWPTGKGSPVQTRGDFDRNYLINIDITNFIDNVDTTAEVDDALLLAQEIEQSLFRQDMANFKFIQFGAQEGGEPFLEIEQLNNRNFFRVPLQVLYFGRAV